MRFRFTILIAVLAASLAAGHPARADHVAAIVVPGKKGVPVIINGQDVSWGVVNGDFGLYRPGHVYPTVTPLSPYFRVPRYRTWPVKSVTRRHVTRRHIVHRRAVSRPHGFFPSTGVRPRVGRRESSSANSGPTHPAQNFSRSWSNEAAPVPADLNPPPPVNVVPLVQPRIRPNSKKP